MNRFHASIAVFALASGAAASGAAADTLTFDGMTDFYSYETGYAPWSEDGYEVQTIGDLGGPEALHVDVRGGPYGLLFFITRPDLALFDLLSLAVSPFAGATVYDEISAQDDLEIEGYRNSVLVASGSASSQGGGEIFSAGSDFVALDEVRLRGVVTSNTAALGTIHFRVDDVSLALSQIDVPVPAGLALLPCAVGALAMAASRRRGMMRS